MDNFFIPKPPVLFHLNKQQLCFDTHRYRRHSSELSINLWKVGNRHNRTLIIPNNFLFRFIRGQSVLEYQREFSGAEVKNTRTFIEQIIQLIQHSPIMYWPTRVQIMYIRIRQRRVSDNLYDTGIAQGWVARQHTPPIIVHSFHSRDDVIPHRKTLMLSYNCVDLKTIIDAFRRINYNNPLDDDKFKITIQIQSIDQI